MAALKVAEAVLVTESITFFTSLRLLRNLPVLILSKHCKCTIDVEKSLDASITRCQTKMPVTALACGALNVKLQSFIV